MGGLLFERHASIRDDGSHVEVNRPGEYFEEFTTLRDGTSSPPREGLGRPDLVEGS